MLLSESLHSGGAQEKARATAVDIIDRLRLRQPMAEAFEALGLEGEDRWRAIARVRLLLTLMDVAPETEEQSAAKMKPVSTEWMEFPAAMWRDPEMQWLVGWNEWEGHTYIAKEPYEELLWWMQLPRIYRMTGSKAASRQAAAKLQTAMQKACREMSERRYRVDEIFSVAPEAGTQSEIPAIKAGSGSKERTSGVKLLARREKPNSSRRKSRKHSKKKPKK
jgi:hypothetical protein